MKKNLRFLTFYILLLTLVFLSIKVCFADDTVPLDVDNLKKYDFDTPKANTRIASPIKNVLTLFVYLFIFLIISYLAYLATKWIGKQQGYLNNKSKYMEVIDCLSLGKESRIYIVKTPQDLYMIGVSANCINILKKLGEEESNIINQLELSLDYTKDDFSSKLEDFIKKIKK